jgi:hypothetical protein
MNFPKQNEAELRKQERLKQVKANDGKIPIDFKFLTIEEIKEEDTMLVEEIHGVKPRDLYTFSKIENLMRPGKSSDSGFLNETEKLWDVYEKDAATLKYSGISYDRIADKLEELINACKGKDPLQEIEYENLKIKMDVYFGWQDCPFGCTTELDELGQTNISRKTISAIDYHVKNNKNDSIFFSELHPHLIRDHHFFEGNTNYRLDPEKFIKFFNMDHIKYMENSIKSFRELNRNWSIGIIDGQVIIDNENEK